jgi:glycosyltransferase involved in cell wall biosynthesis
MSQMNSKTLTLSLVIPVFNEERYLSACLDAIAAQTMSPHQVIVVNNNSSDKSMEIARRYPFVTILTEKQQGIVYARNTGFNAVTADLIGRIDADTVLDKSWVETTLSLAESKAEIAAFTGPCYFYTPLGHTFWFGLHRVIYFWSSRLLFGHTILFGSNMFVRKSAWDDIKDKTCKNNRLHEDMDLAHHLAVAGYKLQFTSRLKATISVRRFKHGWRYPRMWIMTKLVH